MIPPQNSHFNLEVLFLAVAFTSRTKLASDVKIQVEADVKQLDKAENIGQQQWENLMEDNREDLSKAGKAPSKGII